MRVRVRVASGVEDREAVRLELRPREWLRVDVPLLVGVLEGVSLLLAEEEPEPLGVPRGVAVGGSTLQRREKLPPLKSPASS